MKKVLIIIALLFSVVKAQNSLTLLFSDDTGYERESLDLFARMAVQPSDDYKVAIDSVIKKLKRYGTWDKLDVFSLYGLETSQQSLLNWKKDADNPTAGGSLLHIPGLGFWTNGSNTYINTNFSPYPDGVNYKTLDASFGIYVNNDTAGATLDFGARRSVAPTARTSIICYNADNQASFYMHNRTVTVNSVTDNKGLFSTNIASDSAQAFYNGSYRAYTTSTGAVLDSLPFFIGAYNLNGSPDGYGRRKHQAFFAGSRLWQYDHKIIYDAIQYFYEKTGNQAITRDTIMRIVADGNSLTVGFGAAADSSYPKFLRDSLATLCDTVINLGDLGQTTGQMLTIDGGLPPAWDYTSKRNLVIAWELTNSIYYGVPPQAAIDSLKLYCERRHKEGYKVLVVNTIPRGTTYAGGSAEAFNVELNNANALLQAQYSSWADGLIDLRSDARLLDYNDTDYFSADKTHLVGAGYQVVAEVIEAAIRAFQWR